MVSIPRLVIAGISGGSGKTLLSLGIIRAFARRGLAVAPFKKGPDYIDAAWLAQAAGRPCVNLDPFFSDGEQLRSLLAEGASDADIAIIEGNRGLYDGRDADGSYSTSALARLLGAPVLLSLNCTKMTRTAAAIVAGIASFEPVCLAGVALSQVSSARHEAVVRESILKHTGVSVLGALPRLHPNPSPERHMGLMAVGNAAENCLDLLADTVEQHMALDRVLSAARDAPPLDGVLPLWPEPQTELTASAPVIGYVQDDALWFYYPENLEALRRAGARLVRLSLFDTSAWSGLDGIYLGGGFPELLAERIGASPRLSQLRQLSEGGLPVYAECGGFMVLCRSISVNGVDWPMAGVFSTRAEFCSRPQGLGYVEASVVEENPFHPLGTVLRGHEFHYSRCSAAEKEISTLRLVTGVGMGKRGRAGCDGFLRHNTFASYMHLFAPAVPHWAYRFVAACRTFRRLAGGVCKQAGML